MNSDVSNEDFRHGDPHHDGQAAVRLPGAGGSIFQAARMNPAAASWQRTAYDAGNFRHGTGKIDTVYYGCKVIPAEKPIPQIQAARASPELAAAEKGTEAVANDNEQAGEDAEAAVKDTAEETQAPALEAVEEAPEAKVASMVKAPAVSTSIVKRDFKTYSELAHPSAAEQDAFRHGDPHNAGRPVVGLPGIEDGSIFQAARARAAATIRQGGEPNTQTAMAQRYPSSQDVDAFRHGDPHHKGRSAVGLP